MKKPIGEDLGRISRLASYGKLLLPVQEMP